MVESGRYARKSKRFGKEKRGGLSDGLPGIARPEAKADGPMRIHSKGLSSDSLSEDCRIRCWNLIFESSG